jgi:type VI secretion system secreted protein VgrG
MPKYTQAGRSLQITTPPGADQLLPVGFQGREATSQLFRFELDLLAEVDLPVHFEDVLGQSVTVQAELANGETRYFNGMVNRFSQGHSDKVFTVYHAEVVPKIWLLTKTFRSRIFQNLSVPDILHEVLSGYDVRFDLSRTYYPRNYCVQYHESDFAFASRLMEDEGIYYYFKHSESSHQMVVSDAPSSYPKVAGESSITFDPVPEGIREGMRIRTWEKAQELRSAQYTVRDYCFEMPTGNLEESNPILDQVKVGTVTHKLNLAPKKVEVYEYPGGYAKRYDAVDSQGNAYAQGFNQMFHDRGRTVRVRMEEEECRSLEITGTSDCGNFAPGFAFELREHPHGDGEYLLTRVVHQARETGYRAGEPDEFTYENRFTCMPAGLAYRPRRATAKPVIASVQTATVTGPPGPGGSGQNVFCDQYGRVKVHFHWDREGKMDSHSSCWLRVGQIWAGNGWGAFFWPRAGQEVVVAFEDGDPDKPIIVGSVYNAANMPPYTLPAKSFLGGIRSASVSGNSGENFNGMVFNDELGKEHLSLHSEHNMSLNAEKDKMFHGGRNKGERVAHASLFTVGGLPTGGGSGGGDGYNLFGPLDWAQHGSPERGLKCEAVYGDTVLATTGEFYTLTLGNFSQLTVNPLGPLASYIPGLDAFLGGSVGGQAVFTIGSNATFVMGPQFAVTITPVKEGKGGENSIDLKASWREVPTIDVLCGLLGLLSVAWALSYGAFQATGEDSQRATVVKICQTLALVLQGAIVFWATYGEWVNKELDKLHEAIVYYRLSHGFSDFKEF